MGLNSSLAGKTYPPGTYEVTADAIRNYAAATNEDNPAFSGDNPVSPPCFPIVPAGVTIGNAMFDSELGVNLALMVHGEEDHVLRAPIRPGDTLQVETSLESIEAKESGETFTAYTSLTNQEGTLAAEVRSLMFIRGTGKRSRTNTEDEAPKDFVFQTIQKIDDDQTYRYADASGDRNPIHIDPEFAKNMAGLPGIIVHGMCTMAFASKAVLDEVCGSDPARLKRLKVRFSRPVLPGQTITTQGWVEEKRDDIVVYGFETLNPDGAAVIRGGLAEVAV